MGFNLDPHIGKTPDFPKPGITFYDIGPIFEDPAILKQAMAALVAATKPLQPDMIAGVDARGFLFSLPLAMELDCGAFMVRKSGKLPGDVIEQSYALEYGEARLALQTERNIRGQRVVLCDDLLATGGTIAAAGNLITAAGGTMAGAVCVIELTGLNAREKLPFPVTSLQQYEF